MTTVMRELWNSDFFIDDNTLSVNVARLRKKLEEQGLGRIYRNQERDRVRIKHVDWKQFF